MEHIWAPWRIEYIMSDHSKGCILCQKPEENNDEANYILARREWNFVILNLYPYNPGHLLVAPYRHIAHLDDMSDEELREHFETVRSYTKLLKEVFNPSGFNIGINLGRVAGAGIEYHLHTHIVPRWQGDTNFITAISDSRVIPEALAATYQKLKQKLD